ncbi:MAG: hypothetical protein JW931_09560 [Methanomicrobiaceae archaeon]|nr:hypothetical protein [Methanomicrobiaceae archaeon]
MKKIFEEMEESHLVLVLSEPLNLKMKNIEIIKEVTKEGFHVIVITTNNPYSILVKDYEKEGIESEKLFFIDAITKYALGKETEKAENCVFINGPADLTSMGIAVTEVLKKTSSDRVCVLLNTVNSMLIYITPENLIKFVHFIASKLRLFDVSGVFLAVEKGIDPSTLVQLQSFIDEVIDDGN